MTPVNRPQLACTCRLTSSGSSSTFMPLASSAFILASSSAVSKLIARSTCGSPKYLANAKTSRPARSERCGAFLRPYKVDRKERQSRESNPGKDLAPGDRPREVILDDSAI